MVVSSLSEIEATPQPSANGKLPLASFYYAGVVGLLGWNLVLTFTHSFDCDMLSGRTFGGSGWAFWCSLCYSISLNLVQILMSSRTLMDKLSFGTRWSAGLVGIAMAMLGLLSCKVLTESDTEDAGFAFAMVSVALMGFSAGVLQSASFGMAGSISPQLAGAIMSGQGVAGVIASIAGVVFGSSQLGLLLSFGASVLLILLGLPLYALVMRRNTHIHEKLVEAQRVSGSPAESPLSARLRFDNREVAPQSPQSGITGSLDRRRSSSEILTQSAWPQAATVCSVFTVTFVVFPGVTSRWMPGEHVSVLISIFQLLDVLGRFATQIKALQVQHGPTISCMAACRLVFIPAFILLERCREQGWAQNALLQYALMVVFAFSNGYVSTLSMMLGPLQKGLSRDEQEPTGSMMSFSLVFGIFFGSLLALPTQIGVPSQAGCHPTAGSI